MIVISEGFELPIKSSSDKVAFIVKENNLSGKGVCGDIDNVKFQLTVPDCNPHKVFYGKIDRFDGFISLKGKIRFPLSTILFFPFWNIFFIFMIIKSLENISQSFLGYIVLPIALIFLVFGDYGFYKMSNSVPLMEGLDELKKLAETEEQSDLQESE